MSYRLTSESKTYTPQVIISDELTSGVGESDGDDSVGEEENSYIIDNINVEDLDAANGFIEI